jgi:hypothetical protein
VPTGATVLCRGPDGGWLFAGLVRGTATVRGGGAADGKYFVYAGVDRVRELLLVPERHPVDQRTTYRTDDITVVKPAK